MSLFRENDLTAEMVSRKKHAGVLKQKFFAKDFFKRIFFIGPMITPSHHHTTFREGPFESCMKGILFRQVLSEADLLSNFTTNITWRGGELCEGVQVSPF